MTREHGDYPPERDQDGLAARIQALRAGAVLTLIGLDAATLHLPPGAPRLLRLELAGIVGHGAAIARILDDLAALALVAWPDWPEPALPGWGRAAARLAAAGRPPRFRSLAWETQFTALHAAAGAPHLAFPIDPMRPERAAPLIATLEWCCRYGASAVVTLAEMPPAGPPWDRVLHDALLLETFPMPAIARLVPPSPAAGAARGSAVEARMRGALAADSDLAGLFEDEVMLRLGPLGPTPRVDLLWREGKIVVELDGPEHERGAAYAADRHRDYELLAAGYLVLRLTNTEVELDLPRSLEKVRRIVGLRRLPA